MTKGHGGKEKKETRLEWVSSGRLFRGGSLKLGRLRVLALRKAVSMRGVGVWSVAAAPRDVFSESTWG